LLNANDAQLHPLNGSRAAFKPLGDDLDAVGVRSYVSEPNRGRRDWSKEPEAQGPGYVNRRRIRGRRGRRLMCQRGERIDRSFAHPV
jgi:hypothetical protein